MPDFPAVLLESIERVAVLRLNRPEAGNTLTAEMLDCLATHVRTIAASKDVRAVVLTGTGSSFSLGGDFAEFAEALSRNEALGRTYCAVRTSALAEVVTGLYNLSVPVIAAINGQAAGAGFSLALACDIRVAEIRTRFHFAYGALGASTDGGMSWLLPRVVGQGIAMALLFEQPVIRAKQALELGLVSEIVSASDLVERGISLARHLASNAVHSNKAAKWLLRASEFAPLQEHIRTEHEAFAEGLMSPDMRRALNARKQGKSPTFE